MEKRLQKVIAEAGYASRRKAEELIINGHVLVNGELVKTLGTKVDEKAKIEIDGFVLEKEGKIWDF